MVDMPVTEEKRGARAISDKGHRDNRLQRDIVPCDEDEETGPWVPYVHFGV
jgi:hypothetical protein